MLAMLAYVCLSHLPQFHLIYFWSHRLFFSQTFKIYQEIQQRLHCCKPLGALSCCSVTMILQFLKNWREVGSFMHLFLLAGEDTSTLLPNTLICVVISSSLNEKFLSFYTIYFLSYSILILQTLHFLWLREFYLRNRIFTISASTFYFQIHNHLS